MLGFEVGLRSDGLEANADVVLVLSCASREALDAYQNHPHHKEVSRQLGSLLDYWATG